MSKAKILTKEIAQEFISNPTLDLSQFDKIEDDAASGASVTAVTKTSKPFIISSILKSSMRSGQSLDWWSAPAME